LAGSGGDGAQTAAMLIAKAASNEGFDATHIPSYGPESRGGTSYADVHVAEDEVLNPGSHNPQILVAFNAPSLAKFGPAVRKGGIIIYDSSVISEVPDLDPSIKLFPVPLTGIATDLGKALVKNIVALGALQAATNLFPKETFLSTIRMALKDKSALIPLNEEAFAWGIKSVEAL
jgi:Pyruvate/2-oxoacid:ferredoxin oxidoreductase gamma subunit